MKRFASRTNCLQFLSVLLLLKHSHSFTSQYCARTTNPASQRRHQRQNKEISSSPIRSIRVRHPVSLRQDISDYDPYHMANDIEPKTQSLPSSMVFYARFVVDYFSQMRLDRKSVEKVKGRRRAMWTKLNEQRKNIMTLAGYTAEIVNPSFLFLFLGALMTSVVPSYYSKCIHCVSTLTATRGQLLESLVGLGVTSILAALFTGLRGSLFWIGGKVLMFSVKVYLHREIHSRDIESKAVALITMCE
jgi:hypothetical protein